MFRGSGEPSQNPYWTLSLNFRVFPPGLSLSQNTVEHRLERYNIITLFSVWICIIVILAKQSWQTISHDLLPKVFYRHLICMWTEFIWGDKACNVKYCSAQSSVYYESIFLYLPDVDSWASIPLFLGSLLTKHCKLLRMSGVLREDFISDLFFVSVCFF